MSRLRLHALLPPPVLMVALAAIAWGISRQLPGGTFDLPGRPIIALIVIVAGLALNIVPKRGFRRAGTTVDPTRPQRASALVQTGLHAISRNPMYLGHALILAGITLAIGHLAGVVALLIYVLWIDRMQIPAEEQALQVRFGADYDAYRQRVRRWL